MFRIKGVNQDSDTCECCGKTGLKKIVWLDRYEAGELAETVGYGRDCAGRALRMTARAAEKAAEEKDRLAAEAARNVIHPVGDVRSVRTVIVEAVYANGGSLKTLCRANGLLSLVAPWAEARYPNQILNVRWER